MATGFYGFWPCSGGLPNSLRSVGFSFAADNRVANETFADAGADLGAILALRWGDLKL